VVVIATHYVHAKMEETAWSKTAVRSSEKRRILLTSVEFSTDLKLTHGRQLSEPPIVASPTVSVAEAAAGGGAKQRGPGAQQPQPPEQQHQQPPKTAPSALPPRVHRSSLYVIPEVQ